MELRDSFHIGTVQSTQLTPHRPHKGKNDTDTLHKLLIVYDSPEQKARNNCTTSLASINIRGLSSKSKREYLWTVNVVNGGKLARLVIIGEKIKSYW
jgi:hypothetical protein